MRKNFMVFAVTAAAFIVLWYLSDNFDIWFSCNTYIFKWSAKNFLWVAALISAIPALFGFTKYPFISLGGYVVGLAAGELLGGFARNVPPQYLHYGWIILILVFLASAALGLFIELSLRKGKSIKSEGSK